MTILPTYNQFKLLNYRLRRLVEAKVLNLSDTDSAILPTIYAEPVNFPEDLLTQKLLSKDTDPAIAEVCLWHILWQIYYHMFYGDDLCDQLHLIFPRPFQEDAYSEHPTIYGVGEIREGGNLFLKIKRNPSSVAAQETRRRFEESKPEWNFPFTRILIWRVRTEEHSTRLRFTPLPEIE